MYRLQLLPLLLIPFHLALSDPSLQHPANTPIVVIGNRSDRGPGTEGKVTATPAIEPEHTSLKPAVQSEPAQEKPRTTTLRVEGSPKGQFRRYGARYPTLEQVDIVVRNVGSETAESVLVSAILPDGQVVPLEGPASLKRNEKGTYSLNIGQQVKSNAPLRAKLECANCRTRQ